MVSEWYYCYIYRRMENVTMESWSMKDSTSPLKSRYDFRLMFVVIFKKNSCLLYPFQTKLWGYIAITLSVCPSIQIFFHLNS